MGLLGSAKPNRFMDKISTQLATQDCSHARNKCIYSKFVLCMKDLDGWRGREKVIISIAPYKPFMTLTIIDCVIQLNTETEFTVFLKMWDNSLGRYMVCSCDYDNEAKLGGLTKLRFYTASKHELSLFWTQALSHKQAPQIDGYKRIKKPSYILHLLNN